MVTSTSEHAPSPEKPEATVPGCSRIGAAEAGLSTVDELDAAICRLARRIHTETYRMLVLVREFDDRLGWAKWSCRSCAEWLSWRCGTSLSAAREHVRTAQALRHLPEISAAFADGRLSYSKVRALTRAANARNEDLLLAYALEATAPQVEARCRQIRNVAPESAEVARRAWERRSLSLWRDEGRGTMRVTVEVPIEEGEIIANALDRAVGAGEWASGPEFEANGWPAQQADALVAVARAYLAGAVVGAHEPAYVAGADPGESAEPGESAGARAPLRAATADRYQVVVHVDESALRGGPGRSDLPLETVKRLLCDGSMIGVVEDARGQPVDLARKRRTVSASLRRALLARDRGCTFPGCHRAHYLEGHHIRHWADGGHTSLGNTTLLCTYHHRLLHEGGYRIRRDHDGALCFQRPDGRMIPRQGYRIEDVLDEPHGEDEHAALAARVAAAMHGHDPSAEVREARGRYYARAPTRGRSEVSSRAAAVQGSLCA